MSCPYSNLCLRRSFRCCFSSVSSKKILISFFSLSVVLSFFCPKISTFAAKESERILPKSILRGNVLTIYRQVQLLTLANRLILLVDGFTFSLILAAFVKRNTSPSLTIWSIDKPGLLKNSGQDFHIFAKP